MNPASGAPSSTNPAPAASENAPVMRSIVKIRRCMAAVSPFVWARVISGISRPDSAPSTENGKNNSGSAIPFKLPYWATASARLPV